MLEQAPPIAVVIRLSLVLYSGILLGVSYLLHPLGYLIYRDYSRELIATHFSF